MKTRTSLFLSCIALSAFLFGCDSDDAYEHGGVQCNATYVIDDSGTLCYFGECNLYDNDLRDHYCPSAASFCIEDDAGRHYCGTHCPAGTLQSGNMCNRVDNGCESNEILCDGVCIDPKTSQTYCGSDAQCIARPCLPDQVCTNGACVCPQNQSLCEDKCVDTQKALEHCGACKIDCTQLEGWADGQCHSGQCAASACTDGYHTVEQENGSIVCEPDITEPCGSSGEICPIHSVCNPETESCQCETGFDSCENGCFDLMADTEHCGDCTTACNVENADNICNEGVCTFVCHAGYVMSADGSHCEPQQTDACTEGEKRCNDHSFEICKDGVWSVLKICTEGSQCDPNTGCDTACDDTLTFCPPNLCTNIQTDNENCGECGKKCNVANANNICESAKCTFTCNAGYVKTKDGTGCELVVCTEGSQRCSDVNVQTCNSNHWVTTQTCTTSIPNSSATCVDAKCGRKCNSGFTECSGNCIDIQTDINNCGGCGKKCNVANAINSCSSGKCTFTCNPGYVATKDGKCEALVCTEGSKRCSGLNYQTCTNNKWVTSQTCTSVSHATASCSTSGCAWSCNAGYTQCANACINTKSDINNCGMCGNACASVIHGTNTCTNGKCTITCVNNYLQCGNSCVGSTQQGIVHKNTTLYTNPGSGSANTAKQYSIYPIYGQSGSFYAVVASNQKRYINKNDIYILPAMGSVKADTGLNVRMGPSSSFSIVSVVPLGQQVTIVDYEIGSPLNGIGWYHITSPVDGYVSASYIQLIGGSSGSFPDCP